MSRYLTCGAIATLIGSSAACNALLGIDDADRPHGDGGMVDPDATTRVCDTPANISLVAATPTTSHLDHHQSDGGASMLFLLNGETKPDALALELYDSMGGHGAVNAVGAYTLTTGDSVLASCGICVAIYTDYDRNAEQPFSQTYFAVAQGTLRLDTFDAQGLSGSLKGLKLRQVEFDQGATSDVPDGCTVTVQDAEFTAEWSASAASADATPRSRAEAVLAR